MLIPDIVDVDVTRPSRDGGRDAIGKMKIGRGPSAVLVEFALEAKCYGIGNSVGVREMSRLISRAPTSPVWNYRDHEFRRWSGLQGDQGRPAPDRGGLRRRHRGCFEVARPWRRRRC